MKKVFIITVSLFIAFCPYLTLCNFSYAEDTPTSGGGAWTNPTTHEEVVAAFKAYCKSRNFQILHSNKALQAIIAWDYDQFEKNCALLNIDPEGLNAEIWYSYTKSPKYLKWFFNKTAMAKFNQIYGSILAEYNMQYDVPEEKRIYSGKYYVTDTGIGVYTFVCNSREYFSVPMSSETFHNIVTGIGSYYVTTGSKVFAELSNESVIPLYVKDNDILYGYNLIVYKYDSYQRAVVRAYNFNDNKPTSAGGSPAKTILYESNYYKTTDGYPCIIYYSNNDTYWLGTYNKYIKLSDSSINYCVNSIVEISPTDVTDTNITADQGDTVAPVTNKSLTIITDVDTVNNYITNDSHDTYNYSDDDEPEQDPKQKPVPPDSTTPNPNNPSIDTGNPNFNFQMPDINIDWNLDLDPDNLPFPFSIPNDIYHAFDSLNVEAEAPHFEGTVDLYVCDWDIDIDFEQFAGLANIFNKWFLFVYVVGLIIATRSLMHIY